MTDQGLVVDAGRARRVRWTLVMAVLVVGAAAAAFYILRPQGAASDASARDTARPTPVRAAAAVTDDLELTARYSGELHAEGADIAARTPGVLEAVNVRIGDRVEEGDVLARVDTAQLTRQLAEVEAQRSAAAASARRAEAGLGAAQAELDRTEPLLEEQLVSAQEVTALRARVAGLQAEQAAAEAQGQEAAARLELLRQQIRDARLEAPFDGAVAERHLDPGAVVQHGSPVLRLVHGGPLRVRFRVAERDLGRIRTGMPFEVTTHATADERFAGTVERIAAAVSRDDRTAAVEGVLEGEPPTLRPGMYAEIVLQLGLLEDAVTIPGAAILERPRDEGGMISGVFVVEGETARWVPVEVLGRSGDRVAVEGVEPEARVVTLGHETLREGAAVRVSEGSR